MVPETGLTEEPKLAVLLLVVSIYAMATTVQTQGIGGVIRVDYFWDTLVFFTGGAAGLLAVFSLVWVALR